MPPLTALAIVLGLVLVTTAIGLVWRWSQQHPRRRQRGEAIVPADLDSGLSADAWGQAATLVQFSTETCSRCPGVRRMLQGVAADRTGVVHVEVDLTHRADLAERFHVLQTPTTFILDGHGVVQARFGGAPTRATIETELATFAGTPASAH